MTITHHFACPESHVLHTERDMLTNARAGGGDVAVAVVGALASELVLDDRELLSIGELCWLWGRLRCGLRQYVNCLSDIEQ